MKKIDVQSQPVLSAGRVFQIAVTGVKYRLFRAAVTVAVIVVAMAFLMNILTESLIKKSVAEAARDQIEDLYRVDRWIARLTMAQTADEILHQLASVDPDSGTAQELMAMGGFSAAEYELASQQAAEAVAYLDFFEQLNYGRRRVLVGPAESTRIFERLQEESVWQSFAAGLADMRTLRFPAALDEFRDFLERWPVLREKVNGVQRGQEQAIAGIQAALGDTPLMTALRDAAGAFGDHLRSAGFALSAEESESLAVEVRRLEHTLLIEGSINNPGVRQAVAAARDILPGDVTMTLIWNLLRQRERTEWFLGVLDENAMAYGDLTADQLEAIARHRAHARLLAAAERQTMDASGGFMGIGTRMTWLALVSMLVCAVGIANAMLMSVTERFREIATLKCLGALDAFIMSVFLIEAGLLGIVGGLGGAIAGFLLAGTRMAFAFKSLLWDAFPWQEVFVAGLISVLVGMLLAAISAVYPSFRAARLAPMEAMRIE
jgi:hypothetical protein